MSEMIRQKDGRLPIVALDCQLFLPDAGGYSERRSRTIAYQSGPEKQLHFAGLTFAASGEEARIRVDPFSVTGVGQMGRLIIRNSAGQILHAFGPDTWPEDVTVSGTAWRMPCSEGLAIFSYGEDPQIQLPPLPNLAGQTFSIELTLTYSGLEDGEKSRLYRTLGSLRQAEAKLRETLAALETQQQQHESELEALRSEYKERRLGATHCLKLAWERTLALHKAMKSEARRLGKKLRKAGKKPTPEDQRPLEEFRKLLPLGTEQIKEALELAASGLFDDAWYERTYPDVTQDGVDPLQHFVTHGAREGRNPNPHFWTTWYLQQHPDVAATGMNPLLHFVRSGWKEGRNPNPGFNTQDYLKKHEDARQEGVNPLLHFLVNDPAAFQSRAEGDGFHDEDWDVPLFFPSWRERLRKATPAAGLTLSLAMSVHRTPLSLLERAVQSVLNQEYTRWELCMVDDGSQITLLRSRLEAWAESDPRIKVAFHESRKGLCATLNHALARGTGEFVAIISHDDVLTPDALGEVAALLAEQPDTDGVYSDVDKIDETGRCYQPFHRPAWSPVYSLGAMYVDHFVALRRALLPRIGGFDPRFENLPEFEHMLRLSEVTSRIRHIPKILHHSGMAEKESTLLSKTAVAEVQALAVTEHLHRKGIPAKAVIHPQHAQRIHLEPTADTCHARVSLIIPSAANSPLLADCLRSIVEKTTHTDYEILLLVQKDSIRTDAQLENLELARGMQQVRVLEYDFPFNYSRVNNLGASEASGELLVLLNDDTKLITHGWLEILSTHLCLPGVGAVGPKLLYPTGAVQHAGVALGFRGTADHVMRGFCADSDGYHGSLSASREVSAVTAACLMTRKETFQTLKGMNECYASIYQDVDYCLRVRQSGLSVLYVANAELVHHECATRSSDYNIVDREIFVDRWRGELRADPWYNIHFTRNRHDYTLRKPPA